MSDWQPIETAPHDRCVLLCCGDGRLWVGGLSAVLDGAPTMKREHDMARYDILLQLLTKATTATKMADEEGDALTVGVLAAALQDVADLVGRELLVRIVDARNEASKLDPLNAPSNKHYTSD